ncbi:hypothetical protein C439_00110 [Haloferax mediterranei ATCC 33500]|uniref:HIT-type domain-containing protein n=1 Tax=Haloferax mediterranei (strain ATCC 33500 / DSM 1411 / JCM 8866 / NBRC 14739 / NCIMB 2177 / R-4) TaxID=523841 RepID=I3RA01_HALMT|nr:hypothetical protein HFX_5229 [Haloferax mediterranei ATCC 33500]EMA05155.1 hypothetical protein C439_00110 [Haloferax mediterranei ATCC 33500]
MSIHGLCQVCESMAAEQQCQQCGALVCHTHYDEETGLCINCASAVGSR